MTTNTKQHAETTDVVLVALHTQLNHIAGKREIEEHAATKLRDEISGLTILHEQAVARIAEMDAKKLTLHEAITKRLIELGF